MSQSLVYVRLIEPIDFENHALWPNEKIGKYLIAARLGAEAESRGIQPNQIPKELAAQWLEKMAIQESDDVENIALEKALRLATTGYYERAGAILRAWILRGAVNMAAIDEAVSGCRKQRSIAKKPRPRNATTQRSETIAAMSRWRSDGQTLENFLDAASVGSIDGVRIKKEPLRGVERFSVECNSVAELIQPVAFSTLEGWWGKAKK